jgi:hypothetical protein
MWQVRTEWAFEVGGIVALAGGRKGRGVCPECGHEKARRTWSGGLGERFVREAADQKISSGLKLSLSRLSHSARVAESSHRRLLLLREKWRSGWPRSPKLIVMQGVSVSESLVMALEGSEWSDQRTWFPRHSSGKSAGQDGSSSKSLLKRSEAQFGRTDLSDPLRQSPFGADFLMKAIA